MFTEEFEIVKKINGKVVKIYKLDRDEFALLKGGIFYAQVRDMLAKRRDAYKKLLKKLPKVTPKRIKTKET